MSIVLRLGRYQDALADVTGVDLLLVDAPYSERTHKAYSPTTNVLTACERDAKWAKRGGKRRVIDYGAWGEDDVREFVDAWSGRTRGWFVSITDDVLAPIWRAYLEAKDRYVFAQIPFVAPGSHVRLSGDGPSSWTCWVIVAARPRTIDFAHWGTLPGAYILPRGQGGEIPVIGGKPLWLKRALVRDYSRRGELVCDPCCGGGTTLVAAAMEGRSAVGSEMDPATYVLAREFVDAGYTEPLNFDAQDFEQSELDIE